MTVELVPNYVKFHEEYPQFLEYPQDEDEDEDSEEREEQEEENVRKISLQIKDLQQEVSATEEMLTTANELLAVLDKFAKSVTAENTKPEDISKQLKQYQKERGEIFKARIAATQTLADLKKDLKEKEKEKEKAGKGAKKRKQQAEKQRDLKRQKRALDVDKKKQEKQHDEQEKLRYYPRKVYRVLLLLETQAMDTPASSRRNSIDSVTTLGQPAQPSSSKAADDAGKPNSTAASETTVSLTLSYVTKEAGWSPRYDVKISTVQKSATIVYRTEFLNRTSETWKDTKLSFSTSQTSYQGLNEVVPTMNVWRVTLSKDDAEEGEFWSPDEADRLVSNNPRGFDFLDRYPLFHLCDDYVPAIQSQRPLAMQAQRRNEPWMQVRSLEEQRQMQQAELRKMQQAPMPQMQMIPGYAAMPWMQSERRQMQQAPRLQMQAMNRRAAQSQVLDHNDQSSNDQWTGTQPQPQQPQEADTGAPTYMNQFDDYEDPMSLEFPESAWSDNGLTATYDIPGTRTLAPSSMTRRHKIASLHASNISLLHISIPKLRSAFFLRAKIRNSSNSITLLKGSAGITVDSAFLGNTVIPRVAPGQAFDLSLGVDPGVQINYPKPVVQKSVQGMILNKEAVRTVERAVWINNTKRVPVELDVRDQIPVSEDERLRIVIKMPVGLGKEGDRVEAGVAAREVGGNGPGFAGSGSGNEKKKNWGSATATLKKNGEVEWKVRLESRAGCLLKLEYEARMPLTEGMVSVD